MKLKVEKFCTRAIYINNHKIQYDGTPQQATQKYLNEVENKN